MASSGQMRFHLTPFEPHKTANLVVGQVPVFHPDIDCPWMNPRTAGNFLFVYELFGLDFSTARFVRTRFFPMHLHHFDTLDDFSFQNPGTQLIAGLGLPMVELSLRLYAPDLKNERAVSDDLNRISPSLSPPILPQGVGQPRGYPVDYSEKLFTGGR